VRLEADQDQDQDQQRTRLSVLTQFLWETPEVTTAAMAVGQLQMSHLTHRFAAVAQLQRLP
jgi:hypothetical protein